ncbi:hypothetical protein KY285_013059 [Solanum tuberosum]|nr:hypothetical protein KY289_013709 [Solanum tuberosum]KAH0717028.1 hypothetical protein KY285_013059 [Solanum tuberosum]
MGSEMNEIKSMFESMTIEIANLTVRQTQWESQHEKAFGELKESLDEVRRFDRGKSVEGQDGSGEIFTPSGNPMAWVPPPAWRPTMPPYSPSEYPLGVNFMPQSSANIGQNSHSLPTGQAPVGIQGGYGATGPSMQTNHHHGGLTMTRMTKLEFPHFNVTNLRAWLCKVEKFFSLDEIDYSQRVRVVSIHFDDIAIEWHLAYIRSRNHLPLPSWEEYVYALMDRFGAEYADPMFKLKLVKQNGLVEDYQKEFDRIMTRLVLLPDYAISAFITGLKPEIGSLLAKSFMYSGGSSQNKGAFLGVSNRGVTNRKEYQAPKRDHSVSLHRSNTKRLSLAEMSEKRQKGLCFFCDEKFVPGHKCNATKQLYLLEVCDEEEPEEEPEPDVQEVLEVEAKGVEKCEISIHALNGIPGFHTLGWWGSTHNFIDEEIARQLELEVLIVRPQSINVADGATDKPLICERVGDLQLNFQKLTLAFMYQGQKVQLQGNKENTRIVNAKGLDKMTQNGGQLFMIRVFPTEDSTVKTTREIHLRIIALTEEFHLLFGDPKQLHPSISTFDHKILLQKDSNPVN